ncbi:putative multidrug resistance protein EmrK [mine drainage metagenome]|uniref:Putative multidrug resistance protein EmrK n=1 Tax=mine drainage metagenome TaxID=410659 RepID=A0A1J5T5Q6_9ZZZZ
MNISTAPDRQTPEVVRLHPGEETLKSEKRFALPTRRTLIVGAIALAVALGGALYIVAPASTQTTDDAYVSADATVVAPKVRGLIAQVLVQDNQVVHAGDLMVRIDPEEFDARVSTANAELADAMAGVASSKAALVSLKSEEQLASASVRAAESSIDAAKAQAERAIADSRRYEKLAAKGFVAVSVADTYRTAAITAEHDVTRVSALHDVSLDLEAVTRAKRATLEAALQKAEATVERASAALDLTQQDQRHAMVVAPIDGVVGNRQVQEGDYVQPGTRLLTLVPLHKCYVTANFKETQTGRIQAGQLARIEVDALPGHEFLGTVDSLAPGSGSRFALLPFEPGTGNFTKIVQRVAVRVRFDPNQPDLDQLRPGLSATVKVALKN